MDVERSHPALEGKPELISVTIALTRYREPDALLNSSLETIALQENVRARVFVLDQFFRASTGNFCRSLSSDRIAFEYHVIPARGCAHARNVAVDLCPTDILLWTDPDILLPPNWAYTLSSALVNNDCAVAGGPIAPRWQGRPRWYMKSNVMADHYALIDLGQENRKTDRIIGGSMGLNIRRLGPQACFDERLGRKDGTLLGGVDTEFCERVIRKGFAVYYVGGPRALHLVPKARMRLSWIMRKFYYGGISRGIRGGRPSAMRKKREMLDYGILCAFAPLYLVGFVKGALNGQRIERKEKFQERMSGSR
jgi:glycosyltransferase involved in cell wall biosynthesis